MSRFVPLLLLSIWALESQGLNIELSKGIPSTLVYNEGDCIWRLSGIIGGYDVVINAPHILLKNINTGVVILCEVNGTVILETHVIVHETLPCPQHLDLDNANKRLQWDHTLLPELPPPFELIHKFTFKVYAKEDGTDLSSLSVPASNSYYDFPSDKINHCAEYEFVVQAVSNISNVSSSRNSSAVSGYFIHAPSFRRLLANVNTIHQQQEYLHIHVTFELEEENCTGTHPTFFIVILEGLGGHRFDINSTHIDYGKAIIAVPLTVPVLNTCHLKGTIIGGNDAGNCSEASTIQHSTGSKCSSVMVPGRTTSTAMETPSPVPPPQPSDRSNPLLVTGIAAGLFVIMMGLLLIIFSMVVLKKYQNSKGAILPYKANCNEYLSRGHMRPECEVIPSARYDNDRPPTDTVHKCSPSKAKFTLSQGIVTYTEVSPISSKPAPSCDNTPTGYAIVDHVKTQEMAQGRSDGQQSVTTSQCSISTPGKSLTPSQGHQEESGLSVANLEGLLDILRILGSKWYQLGTLLQLSETLLDETQTIVEGDMQCLREILKNWLNYHEPNLQKLNDALSEMNEPTLLYDASNREFAVQSDTPPELPPR